MERSTRTRDVDRRILIGTIWSGLGDHARSLDVIEATEIRHVQVKRAEDRAHLRPVVVPEL